MFICTCAHNCFCMYAYKCLCLCMYVFMCVYVCLCMNICIYASMYVCTCVYVCMYACMCICMCSFIHSFIQVFIQHPLRKLYSEVLPTPARSKRTVLCMYAYLHVYNTMYVQYMAYFQHVLRVFSSRIRCSYPLHQKL